MAVRPTDPEAMQLFQLIGAPLLAVIQAEAQAAQVSAEFIKRIGFDPPPAAANQAGGTAAATPAEPKALQDGGELGGLRMAEFRIERSGADGKPQALVARVPVLSLFPIPLLQVKHADFEFDIRVLSRVPLSHEPEIAPDADRSAPAAQDRLATGTAGAPETTDIQARPSLSSDFLSKDRVELKGFLAPSRGAADTNSVDANIKVRVRMEQSDLPAGLIHLMKIMGDNVTVAPLVLLEQPRKEADAGKARGNP